MERKKDLMESQRGAIIYGHQHRDSFRTIVAAIGCSKFSMWNVIKEFSRSDTEVQKKKKRPGRPKTLTQSDQENLKKLVTNGNRRLNLLQITNLRNCHSEKKVSKSTALAHQDWTVDNFKQVLWSDETTIRLFQDSPGHDNARPHVATVAKEFLEEPGSLDELDALVKKAWNDIPPELIRRLITSMPDRVAACIKAKKGPIKY
ncbi:220_t:CDS:2 [Dentiscutata heterogama]|uniref:220_t:CDS:1 n=1 Tax=Dentiscutata heterogama TaxID=1316150 RepID=A0ACA9MHA2_9GLOM|nr:220_t:CDS:2 [Dentiscutata heterogama]